MSQHAAHLSHPHSHCPQLNKPNSMTLSGVPAHQPAAADGQDPRREQPALLPVSTTHRAFRPMTTPRIRQRSDAGGHAAAACSPGLRTWDSGWHDCARPCLHANAMTGSWTWAPPRARPHAQLSHVVPATRRTLGLACQPQGWPSSAVFRTACTPTAQTWNGESGGSWGSWGSSCWG